jgi:hypothetical protein
MIALRGELSAIMEGGYGASALKGMRRCVRDNKIDAVLIR